ncbi:MAG TPA: type II and III secretion system protein family protein [Sphingomonadaceae bacterium]|nr:type II and III secretion system protein family protein [Sphingomonadaceae bacterium]
MKRRLIATLMTAACAALPLASMPAGTANAQSVMQPSSDIVVSIGQGQLVTVPGNMADIFIANDAIADVQVKSQRQLYIFGKSGGETTLYASDAAGEIIWAVNVRVGSNISSIDQMLALAMPEAKISVATMGTNTVLLTGTVAAPEDASEAERLVSAFVGEGMNVISRMKTATPLQVNLQVKFAEVSRSLVRSLGGNLSTFDTSGGFQFALGNGRNFLPNWTLGAPGLSTGTEGGEGTNVIVPNSTGATIGGIGSLLGLDLAGALDLAERNGLVTTLSQPNLTALSGETAEFLAGGEFPIPISQGLGSTSIQYRKYGVSLSYTPTVLANGRISIRVRPEVSELSSQGAVTINGFQIPGMTIRRAETTIELGSGQAFMIAGLLSNNAQSSIDKAPVLGDLPIIGNLFKSQEFRKGQTELVIIVTPYLVNPVDANDIILPTDGFRAPTAFQQYLGNMEQDGVSGGDRPKPTAVGEEAPPPQVSLDDQSTLPAEAFAEGRGNDDKQAAANPTPGFSLK